MLELNNLYNMDCMRGMKEFPDGYFDLARKRLEEERAQMRMTL